MKQTIYILIAILILGCNSNHKKSDILGTWDCISSVDMKTKEISLPQGKDELLVEFRSDSLYYSENGNDYDQYGVYAWQIKGDSILVDCVGSAYIKKLTKNELIVEYDFLGEIQLTFKKRK